MPQSEQGYRLDQLVDQEDLKLLEDIAALRGVNAEQLAKELIQKHIARRTKPPTMQGTVQPFRRRD